MADRDAASREDLIHHAKAQRKAEVEPDGVADDLGWKAVTGVGRLGCGCHAGHLPVLTLSAKPRPKLTVPSRGGTLNGGRLPETSNCSCHPGKAGGLPLCAKQRVRHGAVAHRPGPREPADTVLSLTALGAGAVRVDARPGAS